MDRTGWVVVITGNQCYHCFKLGEVVTLSEQHEGSPHYWRPKGIDGGWMRACDYIRIEEEIDYEELL
jgi:hypothetical protein